MTLSIRASRDADKPAFSGVALANPLGPAAAQAQALYTATTTARPAVINGHFVVRMSPSLDSRRSPVSVEGLQETKNQSLCKSGLLYDSSWSLP